MGFTLKGGYQTLSLNHKTIDAANPPITWISNSALGSYNERVSYSAMLIASSQLPLTYTMNTGSLPSGISLLSNGLLYGTMPTSLSSDTYNFSVDASHDFRTVPQNFTLTVLNVDASPTWVTAATLGNFNERTTINTYLVANSVNSLSYAITSGSLPAGITFASNGLLSGSMPAVVSNTTSTFTVTATDTLSTLTNSRVFSITDINVDVSPVWVTASALGSITEGSTVNTTVTATSVNSLTYSLANGSSLPSGLSLNANGLISGTMPAVNANTTSTFSIIATDDLSGLANTRLFSLTDENVSFPPVWATSNVTAIATGMESSSFFASMMATDGDGTPVIYSLGSNNLANTMVFNDGKASVLINMDTTTNTIVNASSWTIPADTSTSNLTTSYLIANGFVPTVTSATGKFGGKALDVIGSNALKVDLNNTVTLSGDFTIEAWIRPSGDPHNDGANYGIFGFGDSSANRHLMLTISYVFDYVSVEGKDANGSTFTSYDSGVSPVLTGLWSHVALTRNNGVLNVYLNGVRQYTGTSVLSNVVVDTSSFAIGSQSGGRVDNGFKGRIDDVRLTNSVALYTGTSFIVPTGQLTTNATIYGSFPAVVANTTYYAVVGASDGVTSVNSNFALVDLYNSPPVWVSNGSLGSANENSALNIQLVANDPEGNAVTYTTVSGSLPAGTSLLSNGLLTGTLSLVSSDTISNFTVRASDGVKTANAALSFTVIDNPVPAWVTASALGNFNERSTINTYVVTNSVHSLTYSLASGTLPAGLTFSSNGLISGIMNSVVTNTVSTFTINAVDSVWSVSASKLFTMNAINIDTAPVWTYTGDLGSALEGTPVGFNVTATSTGSVSYSLASGSLPSGTSLLSNGYIYGTLSTVNTNTVATFGITATDTTSLLTNTAVFSATTLNSTQANTTVLMNMDTANVTTLLPVEGVSTLPVSYFGTKPVLSNTVSKNGNSTVFLNSGSLVITGANTVATLSGDFTAECWIYPQNIGNALTSRNFGIFAFGPEASQNTICVTTSYAGHTPPHVTLIGRNAYSGGQYSSYAQGNSTLIANTWTHVALTRTQGNVTVWVNGTKEFTDNKTYNFGNVTIQSSTIAVGSQTTDALGSSSFIGYIDDFRLSNGIALYTNTFTPPSQKLT